MKIVNENEIVLFGRRVYLGTALTGQEWQLVDCSYNKSPFVNYVALKAFNGALDTGKFGQTPETIS